MTSHSPPPMLPYGPMATASLALLVLVGTVLPSGLLWFGVVSLVEREWRAAMVSLCLAVGTSAPLLGSAFLPPGPRLFVAAAVACILVIGLVSFLLPLGHRHSASGNPSSRVDERDIQFARFRLLPGSPQFDAYYEMRPEKRPLDDSIRELPGLLSDKASLADPDFFSVAREYFDSAEKLRDAVDGPVADRQQEWKPEAATPELKALAKSLGAVDAGTTGLDPIHIYSHVGRGTGTWGEAIELRHSFAIAFTVEMDHRTMQRAPTAPVVAESARQYLAAAEIAVELAATIRARGYCAKAHIDGNYRVIAPLVARSAGLGEIGRMGILMTPRLGPRVRLGVVTTDLPLITRVRAAELSVAEDLSIVDACTICSKCADCCPGSAIPSGDRTPLGSSGQRWSINSDACFRVWNQMGTDCGRCMAVCPYSHPDSSAHNLVRWAMRRSGMARRLLITLDDLFYGKRPPSAS
jgi:ferredoxin